MRRRNGKSSKRGQKAQTGRSLENSLSDFVLTQSRVKQRGAATWRDISARKESPRLRSRQLRSPVKRLAVRRPIAIDRDKRFRRKQRAQLDMDTLLPIKKKGTMCIPTSGSRESSDSGLIGGAATLPSASEIAGQTPASGFLASAESDWAKLDPKSEEVLEFLHARESFDDQTSEDISQSCLAELSESEQADGQPFASTNRVGPLEMPCLRDREVSTSANAASGAVEESAVEPIDGADRPPISGRTAVHHLLETFGIPRREVPMEDPGGRGRSFDSRAANPASFLSHCPPDPEHERTLADELSMSIARSPSRGALARNAEASGEKTRSQGVYLDEDYHFLMSLHRQLNGMPLVRKMKVKVKIQTLLYEELRARIREPHAAA